MLAEVISAIKFLSLNNVDMQMEIEKLKENNCLKVPGVVGSNSNQSSQCHSAYGEWNKSN